MRIATPFVTWFVMTDFGLAARLDSWERRAGDAVSCKRCNCWPLLGGSETVDGKQRWVLVDRNGREHGSPWERG